jgi:succinate dehydrogenase / fumarate reductase cytochrome b subunit
MASLTSSTIGRKYAMALSAMFLLIFLVVHFAINFTSIFSQDVFNSASEFMGHNPLIQFVMQPLLLIGVVFHFVMGFVLEIKNKNARPIGYNVNNGAANSTWMSRNMIISGAFILVYLFIHLGDFWVPTISKNYLGANHVETDFEHLQEKFQPLWRVVLYVVAFVLLGLHLAHGFQSSFQSIGARHPKYTPVIKAFGNWYSILIPAGFIIIAIFHYVTQ